MKRYGATKSRIDNAKPNDDKLIISSVTKMRDLPSYVQFAIGLLTG